MKQVPLIRIVDDDPSVGASFRFVLEAVGYQVRTYESAAEFLDGDDPTREGCMLLARGCELHRRRRAVARDLKRAEVLWNELTDAERRTAELVAKGLPNRQAAEILGLSEDTVRSRRASVFGKLELHNAAELSEFLHDMAELRTEAHWWRTAE